MSKYTKDKFEELKYKFNRSNEINENCSQAYQDMFILTMLNGKENGSYVEIGASDGKVLSNTYLLEKQYKWWGVSVDIEPHVKPLFDIHDRTSNLIIHDALTLDYKKVFEENGFGKQIDYLQLDIEPQYNTLNCLKRLPLDEYRFSVITYETDLYDPHFSLEASLKNREESRRILLSHGYELIVGNICNLRTDDPFEDWYVDPTVVSPELIALFKASYEFNNTADVFLLK